MLEVADARVRPLSEKNNWISDRIGEHPAVVCMPSLLREGAHSQGEAAKCRSDLES